MHNETAHHKCWQNSLTLLNPIFAKERCYSMSLNLNIDSRVTCALVATATEMQKLFRFYIESFSLPRPGSAHQSCKSCSLFVDLLWSSLPTTDRLVRSTVLSVNTIGALILNSFITKYKQCEISFTCSLL